MLRISHLLEDRVSRIRPEPLGTAGTGIELEVDIDGVRWGEQTKDDARNWTINRLIRERVLAAAKFQIDRGVDVSIHRSSQFTTQTDDACVTWSLRFSEILVDQGRSR